MVCQSVVAADKQVASRTTAVVAMNCGMQQDCSRPAGYNIINCNDVTSHQNHVTSSTSSPYSSQRGQEVGDDFTRHTVTDNVARCVPTGCNASPRRSILKKPLCSGAGDSTSAQLQQLRRSSLNVCRQQVLAEDRVFPVNGAERSRTATTKRVTFCV